MKIYISNNLQHSMAEFTRFPRVIAEIIAGYAAAYQLLPWIQRDNLCDTLYKNPRVSIGGFLDLSFDICSEKEWNRCYYLVSNPAAIDLIRANWKYLSRVWAIWSNPAAIDLLLDDPAVVAIDFGQLCLNPSKRAIAILERNQNKIDWDRFSANPGAAASLRANPKKVSKYGVCGNSEMFDLIIRKKHTSLDKSLRRFDSVASWDEAPDESNEFNELDNVKDFDWFCINTSKRAIEYLRTHQYKINWHWFSENPSIFELRIDPIVIDALTA